MGARAVRTTNATTRPGLGHLAYKALAYQALT